MIIANSFYVVDEHWESRNYEQGMINMTGKFTLSLS